MSSHHSRAALAALAAVSLTAAAQETTLTWDLPTRLEHCVDSGPVLDRLEGTRVYQRVGDVRVPTTTWTATDPAPGTHHFVLAAYTSKAEAVVRALPLVAREGGWVYALLSPIVTASSPLPAERAPASVYGVTQDDGISLNEAIERVRRLPDFRRLLSASTEARGNREVHFVKYMAQDGTVRKQSFTGRRR